MLQIILVTPNTPVNPNLPNFIPSVEFSILAGLAVFLIKGVWKEHTENEQQEREMTDKLLKKLLDDE
jgi:hypothetical protein